MSNVFNSNWLQALTLPTKVSAALFLSFAILLLFDDCQILLINKLPYITREICLLGMILFGCLSSTSLVAVFLESIIQRRKVNLLAERRRIRREEQDQVRAEQEAATISRLEYLSKEELHYVVDCLQKNEQSFLGYVYSGPISNLVAKGLVSTPAGTHDLDMYPFFFLDFAWQAMLKRKDKLITQYEGRAQNARSE